MSKADKVWKEVFKILMTRDMPPRRVTKEQVRYFQQARLKSFRNMTKLMGDSCPSLMGIARSEDIFNEVCDKIDEFERQEAYKEFDELISEVLGE